MAAGITIYAPSIILSIVLGWNLAANTYSGWFSLLSYTLFPAVYVQLMSHKSNKWWWSWSECYSYFFFDLQVDITFWSFRIILVAQIYHRTKLINTEFNWQDRYNLWSGLTMVFPMLAYFGTDQSQVQRYLGGSFKNLPPWEWSWMLLSKYLCKYLY